MTNEQKQTYSYRIAQASKTELVVILYDMANDYIEDALKSQTEIEKYRLALKRTNRVIDQLIKGLDMQYDVSLKLLQIYSYANKTIIHASTSGEVDELKVLQKRLSSLRESFDIISKEDKTGPIMKNTQQVYAGLTYSNAGCTNEFSDDAIKNRGYTV